VSSAISAAWSSYSSTLTGSHDSSYRHQPIRDDKQRPNTKLSCYYDYEHICWRMQPIPLLVTKRDRVRDDESSLRHAEQERSNDEEPETSEERHGTMNKEELTEHDKEHENHDGHDEHQKNRRRTRQACFVCSPSNVRFFDKKMYTAKTFEEPRSCCHEANVSLRISVHSRSSSGAASSLSYPFRTTLRLYNMAVFRHQRN
jgi:hypothetical protein